MADEKTKPSESAGTKTERPGGVEEHGDYASKPEDGVFAGNVRYEGTVLVDREIDGEVVSVLTDKPREGDKVQKTTFDEETGQFVTSSERNEKPGAARMPGKS